MQQGSYAGTENKSQVYNAQKGQLTHPISHGNSKAQPEEEFGFPNSRSTTSKYLHDVTIIYTYGLLFDSFQNILTCITSFPVIINE